MTRFLLLSLTLIFCSGCMAPVEEHYTPFPTETDEDMRNFGNNNSFGTTEVIPFSLGSVQFPESMSVTMLNVDLTSILDSENIESEIIRVPGNWVLTVHVEVDYGSNFPSFAPLLAVLEMGSGGARTSIEFNPSRFSQLLVPASNVRLHLKWDQQLAPFSSGGNSARVTALLQRSPFVENRAFKAFGVTTQGGIIAPTAYSLPDFTAPIPYGAKSWSFVGNRNAPTWDDANSLQFDGDTVGHRYLGSEMFDFFEAGINVPIKGLGETFRWLSTTPSGGYGFIRFNL